jgi:hypothetical protein
MINLMVTPLGVINKTLTFVQVFFKLGNPQPPCRSLRHMPMDFHKGTNGPLLLLPTDGTLSHAQNSHQAPSINTPLFSGLCDTFLLFHVFCCHLFITFHLSNTPACKSPSPSCPHVRFLLGSSCPGL